MLLGIVAAAGWIAALYLQIRNGMAKADLAWCMDEDDRKCDQIIALREELRRTKAMARSLADDLGRLGLWAAKLEKALPEERRLELRSKYAVECLCAEVERKVARG